MTTGQKVKYLRQRLGLTQEELANKIGWKTKSSVAATIILPVLLEQIFVIFLSVLQKRNDLYTFPMLRIEILV